MITYEVLRQIEGDIDTCGNYITLHYDFPFPEDSIVKARELEANRIIQQSFVTSIKQSLIKIITN